MIRFGRRPHHRERIARRGRAATGAWFDPAAPGGLERHSNPNVLTLDKGISRLAQSPISQTALVEVEAFRKELPQIEAFPPPDPAPRAAGT